MTAKFDALAASGTAQVPLNDTFWSARFGMLVDAHGIRWMFNCETKRGCLARLFSSIVIDSSCS
jgi:uncharacterized glyoxalase superfamily protein PhnB